MFVTSTDSPQIAFENDPEDEREEFAKTSFLNLVSRGKLMMPSPLVYEAGMQCLRLHSEIFDNSELRGVFLNFKNPRDTFAKAFELQIKSSEQLSAFF